LVGVSAYVGQIDELIDATGVVSQVDQIRWGPSLYGPAVVSGVQQSRILLEGYSPVKSEQPARQAAADALLGITNKIGEFRGESRFTTWAYKFVILNVSAKIGRHFWRHPSVRLDAEDWDRLPARFGFDPAQQAEYHDLMAALRRAVNEELTPRQRQVFVAIVLNGAPLDALVIELASNRNAIYKTLFDARRKLRAVLVANGYMYDDPSRQR
jgi:RNA polymerase sigma-70 factor (ECF subfamily)